MKILFIGPLPEPITGQSVACKLFYDALLADGHEVRLVNLSKGSLKSGVSSVRRFVEIMLVIFSIMFRQRGCDLVYFNPSQSMAGNIKDLLIYAVLGDRLAVTYAHLHGGCGAEELLSGAHPVLRRINAFFLRKLAGVIVLGPRHIPIFQSMVCVERIHVVNNFAADEVFVSDDGLQHKLAESDRLRVLYLSNFLPGKGYRELVAAVKLLPTAIRAHLEFDFAGAFDSAQAKKEFLRSIEGLEGVRYQGQVQGAAKVALLQHAHILCLPTYYAFEGQPISILEGYAAGCAIITSDHGGISDVFVPECNGKLVAKRSAESIALALEALVRDRVLLANFATNNVDEARKRYRPVHHLAQLFQRLGLRPERTCEQG